MDSNENRMLLRILCLITTPKLSEKAIDMFRKGNIPVQYQCNALGTASSGMMDILGLGTADKRMLFAVLPKPFADNMIKKLRDASVIGTKNSGIAFTLPMSGVNSFILRMLEGIDGSEIQKKDRKDIIMMEDMNYALVAAVVNQGYSENVMEAARNAGAGGGTVVSGRRIGNQAATEFWGMSIQEEKEMVFIITEKDKKLEIMQAIGEKCGVHSEANGLVVSLPIDTVIGVGGK